MISLPSDADNRNILFSSIYRYFRQQNAVSCTLANGVRVLLPRVFLNHIAAGDEIAFPIPTTKAAHTEVIATKSPSSTARTALYLASIKLATKPKLDKNGQSYVSALVHSGPFGISSVFLPCETIHEYFYGIGHARNGSESNSLYKTLRIESSASPAEIRVAFKLRSLELKTNGAAGPDHVRLSRAFNILGHPELRAHYDRLLADQETPAAFPYGGVGLLLVAGEFSTQGETFFARRILAFVPDKVHRNFRLPLRYCDFYVDKALCRDVRRKLRFWLDPDILRIDWDPSWNRWKHLLSAKIEVEGTFVTTAAHEPHGGSWKSDNWETGLPSRLSVKVPPELESDIERARSMYRRFGRYSRALDQIRLCLEHKAIERKELEKMCCELGIPCDFDVSQINWHPDYDPLFYRELLERARRTYLFRGEYIFDLERTVIVETPQLGHATYLFGKPANMEHFLLLYSKARKKDIRHNRDNIAERLGYSGRIIHGRDPRAWLEELRERLGERRNPDGLTP